MNIEYIIKYNSIVYWKSGKRKTRGRICLNNFPENITKADDENNKAKDDEKVIKTIKAKCDGDDERHFGEHLEY